MLSKNLVFSNFGFRAGQTNRQKIPVEVTQTKAWPSYAASFASMAAYSVSGEFGVNSIAVL